MPRRWMDLARLIATTTLLALTGLVVGALPAAAEQTGHPTITVNPIPRTAVPGTILKAQATLSNAVNPNERMGFELYDPTGALFSDQKVTVTANGTYLGESFSPAQKTGTWTWKVQFSDPNNFLAIGTATVVVRAVAPPAPTPPVTDKRAWVWPMVHQCVAELRKVFSGLK